MKLLPNTGDRYSYILSDGEREGGRERGRDRHTDEETDRRIVVDRQIVREKIQ